MVLVIRRLQEHFNVGIGVCARPHDGKCSGWFPEEQGLHQRGVQGMLVPFLLSTFLSLAIHVALTCFKADKDAMNALVSLSKDTGEGVTKE